MKLPFELPPTKGHAVSPSWDGRNFIMGEQSTPVLEYSGNSNGWSDELSLLHEEAIGNRDPLNAASRKDALWQVKKFLPSSKAVILEIGCSSGYLVKELSKTFPEAVVLGADLVKGPLERLALEFPGIPLLCFDLLHCPLPNESVDVLVMLNVLEHIDNDLAALQKAYDLLKPAGTLIIEVPAGPGLYGPYDKELLHYRRYSSAELSRKLLASGFKVGRKSHLGFFIFPAFALVKLLDRWFSSARNKPIVREQAARTSVNPWVKWAMAFESKCFPDFQLPFGIRVLAVGIKG